MYHVSFSDNFLAFTHTHTCSYTRNSIEMEFLCTYKVTAVLHPNPSSCIFMFKRKR